MISQAEVERYLADWLGNAPMDPADRVVVAVAVRIRRQRQRPALRLSWSLMQTSAYARFLAGSAAVLLVAVVGFTAFTIGRGSIGGPASPPPPSNVPTSPPTAAPAASPSPLVPGIGAIYDGDLPSGWRVTAGLGRLLSFHVAAGGQSMSVELLPNQAVMAASCKADPEPGVGTTADDVLDALVARPGVNSSNRGPIVVAEVPGEAVDIALDASTGPTCPTDNPAFVPLVGMPGPSGWEYVGVFDEERMRLIVLDFPDGQNVVVFAYANDAAAFDRYIGDAMTIIENVSFDVD